MEGRGRERRVLRCSQYSPDTRQGEWKDSTPQAGMLENRAARLLFLFLAWRSPPLGLAGWLSPHGEARECQLWWQLGQLYRNWDDSLFQWSLQAGLIFNSRSWIWSNSRKVKGLHMTLCLPWFYPLAVNWRFSTKSFQAEVSCFFSFLEQNRCFLGDLQEWIPHFLGCHCRHTRGSCCSSTDGHCWCVRKGTLIISIPWVY